MRRTLESLIPLSAASVRVDQWVAFDGLVWVVLAMTSRHEAQRDPWGAPMYARAKGVDRAEVATAIATRDLKQKAKNYVEYTLRRAEERIRPVWQIGMGI